MKAGLSRPAKRNLGRLIRCWRLIEELNLREAGRLLGISAPSVMRLEQGREVDASTFLKLMNWMMRDSSERGRS